MVNLERANHHSPVTWKSLVGLLLVPILVALGFLAATWGAQDRLHRVQAAVVNLDEMVELNGQPVPLGRQLAAGLVERRDDNFTWVLSDADNARRGLESGRYAAVITIPKEFSASATSFAGTPAEAKQATITVETSKVTGIADGAIAQMIAETAKATFNTELTETYLDNIYLGFNETKDQFRTVADGAGQLADGGDQLADGMLASATGAGELATGVRTYSNGVFEAASGADDLATGAEQLAAGGPQLASGATDLAGGAGQLATGLETMATETAGLPVQTRELADGTAQFADGVRLYVGGVDQLVTGLEPMVALLSRIDTSQIDVAQLQAAADRLASLQGQAQAYHTQLEAFIAQPCPVPEGVEFTPEQQQAFCAEWDRATAALTTPSPETGGKSVLQWSGEIANSPELAQAITTTRTMLPQLPQLIEQAGQLSQLKPAGQQLITGADLLANGTGQLADGMVPLTAGIQQAATGSRELANGMGTYAGGVGQYTTGVGRIATGTRDFATGMDKLADGSDELATGTEGLAQGLGQAAEGGRTLADGQRTLADGLAEGATKIPTYSEADREALKTAVAQPINRAASTDLIPAATSTSLLMVLALWLGGLATYLVIQAISSRALTSTKPTWQLAARSLAPGAGIAVVQTIALTIIGQQVLGLPAARTFAVLAMLLLGGTMFVVINHALVSWFGGLGRLVSVAMVTVTAASGVLSAVPPVFDVIAPMLPLTPVLHGVRAIVTEGGGITEAVAMTILWLLIGVTASIGAIVRRRTVSPEQYARLMPAKFALSA